MNIIELLEDKGALKSIAKGEYIFQQGERNQSFYVVKSGLIKAYYLSLDGKEHVKSFIFSGGYIASLTSCHSLGECSFSLLCLEPTEVLEIEFSKLWEMVSQNLTVSNYINEILLELSMKKERREFELLCLTAEERYQLLCEREPKILEQITQNDIARYLGVTPVALSRIKKRLAANETC